MSAMNDMLADILRKALPPEIVALMTPENIEKFRTNADAFVSNLTNSLENIQAQGRQQLELLNNIVEHQAQIMERLENGGHGSNRQQRGKPRGDSPGSNAGNSAN